MADNRFNALASDPRYRLPSRKESRTAVDPRFKTLFTDQEFRKKSTVDRYGRKIQPDSNKKDLEKLYRLEGDDSRKTKLEAVKKSEREVVGSSDDEDDEEEDASEEEDVLDAQLVEKRDLAREGFSESSSEEEDSEDESDIEAELAEETAGQEQDEDIPMGEVARRIAAVNLDWDNIRAVDIMAVASSFVPTGGRIESVTVYPSEFGRERLEREELEGPPREIFASSKQKATGDDDSEVEESSDDDEKIKKRLLKEQAEEGEEFDTAKLRQYQLERLRYYYAVIECSNNPTAKALYDAMDGREYLTTSNFFDLRFVPDETSFDEDRLHDECFEVPTGYKPNEFRTEALTHSKVRLTWDDDDATRKEVQKRAFSRAEIDENDLQAYIGTDDSDVDSIASRMSTAEQRKIAKKAAQKDTMRSALGLGAEPEKSKKGGKEEPVGDMQITFTSGLTGGKEGDGVFENEPQDEESTRARYIRKERERKQKRKEKSKTANGGAVAEDEAEKASAGPEVPTGEEDPFNDPFFTDSTADAKTQKLAKKAEKAKKRQAREAQDAEAKARRAELELLVASDQEDNLRHFNMREIDKAKKLAKRKGKNGSKSRSGEIEAARDEFEVQTQDPRFSALFESHEYAIDPTNPKFKGTEGMKALLEEGRRKRKVDDGDGEERSKPKVKKAKAADDVGGLVERLKRKDKAIKK